MKELVIFDLDGTLLNTIADLAAGVNHTLVAHGLPEHTIDEYTLMVGNGMRKLVMRALPDNLADDDDFVDNMLAEFLKYYADHIDVYTKPYPGIPELIKTLSTDGYKLAVASNKIQAGAEKLIAKFFPDIPFVAVMGNSPKYPLKPDAALVEYIMDKAGTDRAHTIMVGDSGTDIQTARNAGIPVIAVSWGFRPRHELTIADCIADSTSEVIARIRTRNGLEIKPE
ncbi:MAG: HAD-IIIA family hydrolase [Bacteroidaceae bacterium]|nr:HAD-IIIA family hydrolase [Bacteroidaceae bacterium]